MDEIPSTRGAWMLIALSVAICIIACTQTYRWTPYIQPAGNHNLMVEQVRQTLKERQEKVPEVLSLLQIKEYILQVFPESEWANALSVANCESNYNPAAHGDRHLMFWDEKNQEMVGDSIGVFQIRTGGKDGAGWNRARANGMSAEEFRNWMFNAKENIDYAYTIWKRYGWQPWSCSGAS